MGRSRKLQDIKSLEFKRNLIKNLRNLKTFFNEARRRHLNTFSKTNKRVSIGNDGSLLLQQKLRLCQEFFHNTCSSETV